MPDFDGKEERMEIGLRILGNEILGLYINSLSNRKNWIILSIVALILLTLLANQLIPLIQIIAGII